MANCRIKRPRVALVSYAEVDYDRLPCLMGSLERGGIREVLAFGRTSTELRRQGFQSTRCVNATDYLNHALRNANRKTRYVPDMPSIDMLCATFSDVSRFKGEFGKTNDTQNAEIIEFEDLDRVALILSACAGRRVVTAAHGWEQAIGIDLSEGRPESEAWIAGRIREAMQVVHRYVGTVATFQKQFARRMETFPRTDCPSGFEME